MNFDTDTIPIRYFSLKLLDFDTDKIVWKTYDNKLGSSDRILEEQNQNSAEHTNSFMLYFVQPNQSMLVEQNHTMPVEQTNVTPPRDPA